MKITLAVVGRMNNGYLSRGVEDYTSRLNHYVPFSILHVPDVKNARSLTQEQQKEAEGRNLLAAIDNADHVVLLDERGTQFTSVDFAKTIEKKMAGGMKRLLFVVGGPYGFSRQVYDRANDKISLSRMTFSHEMVRLVFVEQLYRAMTILRNEPYHHE